MNKKMTIFFVMIVLGFLLIISGLFCSFVFNNEGDNIDSDVEDMKEEDSDNKEDVVTEDIDYDYAYNIAVNLYGGEGIEIEVLEEAERFVIYVLSSNDKKIYYMDKVTGDISSGDVGTIS